MASTQLETKFTESPLPLLQAPKDDAVYKDLDAAAGHEASNGLQSSATETEKTGSSGQPVMKVLTLLDEKNPKPVTATTTPLDDHSTKHVEEATPQAPHNLTSREVATHSKPDDLWLIIDGDVYDVTKFREEHPGGSKVLSGVAGKDATKKFDKYHRRAILQQPKFEALRIGVIVPDSTKAGGADKTSAPKRGLFGKWRS